MRKTFLAHSNDLKTINLQKNMINLIALLLFTKDTQSYIEYGPTEPPGFARLEAPATKGI